MALNIVRTNTSTVAVQVPINTAPGDPVVIGSLRGIAEAVFDSSGNAVANTADANGFATLRIAPSSIFNGSVLATTDDTGSPLGGASAVSLGDLLYKDTAAETISKTTGGKILGVALGTKNSVGAYATGTQVAAGATGVCDILLQS